ncbi:MAG: hypothetical protein Q9203_001151 [Teloschistes exilis]
MSIIPYNYAVNREVVLRHNESLVVYDPQSKQLALQDVSQDGLDLAECPYCHRPLPRDDDLPRGQEQNVSNSALSGDPLVNFQTPDYFRLLHDSSQPASDRSGLPSAPRRLVQPAGQHGVQRPNSLSDSARPHGSGTSNQAHGPRTSAAGISATAFSPGYFERFFVAEKELGRGGKGVVILVRHVLDGVSLGQFACKRVPVGDDHQWLEKILIEVQLLQYLSHQHLVSYRHVWLQDFQLSQFSPSVPCAFILQQYCNSGDLHKFMLDSPEDNSDTTNKAQLKARLRRRSQHQFEPPKEFRGRKLHFDQIYSFFKDIASGLNHLHANRYIHRDLKPSNCLLHDSGKGGLRVLVSDFGEVQVEHMVRRSTGSTGTISYCAPEVLRRTDSGALGNFTTSSDVFSLGMILYFLCFSKLPYRHADGLNEENEDLDRLKEEITSWSGLQEERKLRSDLPEQLYTFLQRLLSLEPDDRPSTEEILHGIRTGPSLDEVSDARPLNAFEDLRSTSRISPIDSPQGGTPRPHTPTRQRPATGYTRAGGPVNLRLASFQKAKNIPQLPYAEEGSTSPTSPSDSLVLREPYPSPTKSRKSMAQLPAPPHSRFFTGARLGHPSAQRSLKIVFLLLKLISISSLCRPMAVKSVLVYPLLAFAAFDLVYNDLSIYISILLAVLHVVLVFAFSSWGCLCISRLEAWEGA